MGDRSISFQLYSFFWIGGDTFTQFLVSFLDGVFVNNDRRIIFALSSDTGIQRNYSNHCSVRPARHIAIRIAGRIFTKLLGSLMDTIYIQYITRIMYASNRNIWLPVGFCGIPFHASWQWSPQLKKMLLSLQNHVNSFFSYVPV